MIQFAWDIHHSCNYRCPYCWFNDKWEEISKNNIYPGLQRLVEIWKTVYDKYGSVKIQINGGEPFTYPNFTELIDEISRMHKVGITTNLSTDISLFLEKVNAGNVHLGVSFHPLFADLDNFLKKVIAIKESGITTGVLFLAYPAQINSLFEYKRIFNSTGIEFTVLTFWGKYKGKEYPHAYSEDEHKIISSVLGVRGESGEKFQLSPKSTLGKLCRAGQTYALIHPNGNVYRCGGGNWKKQHEPFSNLFRNDFCLLPESLPCDSDECPCNEWSFLLTDSEK